MYRVHSKKHATPETSRQLLVAPVSTHSAVLEKYLEHACFGAAALADILIAEWMLPLRANAHSYARMTMCA